MTYFCTEERKCYLNKKQPIQIGPGSYHLQHQQSHSNENYAPFGSLDKKNTTYKHQKLGPGLYNVAKNLVKPNITKYENKRCIIIKINDEGGSQFKSRTNRFSLQKIQNQTPGPGSYDYYRSKSNKKKIKTIKTTDCQKIIQENDDKNKIDFRLKSDPIKVQETNIIKKFKGINWNLSHQERFTPIVKQVLTQKDKQIIVDKLKKNIFKNKNTKQSAVFRSKSIKSQLECSIYKTNNPSKIQLAKLVNYFDDSPGPCSYQPKQIPEIYQSQINKYQFFGSTVPRFGQVKEEDSLIGPGFYYNNNSNQKKQSKHKMKVPKQQPELNRLSFIQADPQIPGPGSYELNNKFYIKQNCSNQNFGSRQPRFAILKTQQSQNIHSSQELLIKQDHEKSKQRQHRLKKHRNYLSHHQSSTFVSATKRSLIKKQTTPFGVYKIENNDISSKMNKYHQKYHGFGNFKGVKKPSFLSSNQRFDKLKKQEQSDHTGCWCLAKSLQKQVFQHQSPSFASKQERIQVFNNQNNKNTSIPIGQYYHESTMIQNSFNSKFIKSNVKQFQKHKRWENQNEKKQKKQKQKKMI